MKNNLFLLASILLMCASCASPHYEANGRWTVEKADRWNQENGWRSGCNYIPSNAINQIEMWQATTFSPQLIDQELGWAEELGFNTIRVYLSSVVWKAEADGFKNRIDQFLTIADKHHIKPLFVFFDDCWNAESTLGEQPAPKPGVHNSGWVQDPAHSLRADTTTLYPVLEAYVKDILTTFKGDNRILLWDLYNEPGNSGYDTLTLPLLRNTFRWARAVRPSQPLTSGVWTTQSPTLNRFQEENSDIISYHNYNAATDHALAIDSLQRLNRPLYCTEYMARTNGSTFQEILPLLKNRGVAAINWGFVAGKTNTIFAWSTPLPDAAEPPVWFHDILRTDGTPFSQEEITLIKTVNGKE